MNAHAGVATEESRRRWLLLLCFLGFVALGLPDGLLGVAWPSMRRDFLVPIDAVGRLFITATTGYVLSSMVAGTILARIGIGWLLAASTALTALSLIGYVIAPTWSVVTALGFLVGVSAGAIDTGINAHAALQYSPRTVNVLHAFYGVGAATGPALMTSVLSMGGVWRTGYTVVTVSEALLAGGFLLARHLWPEPAGTSHASSQGSLRRALRSRVMQLSIVVFVLYAGVEASMGVWTYQVLHEARAVGMPAAGATVTAFWIGLFGSRLAYAFLPRGVAPGRVIVFSLVLGLAALAVYAIDMGAIANSVAVATVGFACGPVFPCLISLTAKRFDALHVPNVVGVQIAAAAIGLAGLPAISGFVAATFELKTVPWLLLGCWCALAVAYNALERASQR